MRRSSGSESNSDEVCTSQSRVFRCPLAFTGINQRLHKQINHICVSSTFEGNLELIYKSVSDALELPLIRFESLFAMMDYLRKLDKRILLIIDEYPYLKQTKKTEKSTHIFRS